MPSGAKRFATGQPELLVFSSTSFWCQWRLLRIKTTLRSRRKTQSSNKLPCRHYVPWAACVYRACNLIYSMSSMLCFKQLPTSTLSHFWWTVLSILPVSQCDTVVLEQQRNGAQQKTTRILLWQCCSSDRMAVDTQSSEWIGAWQKWCNHLCVFTKPLIVLHFANQSELQTHFTSGLFCRVTSWLDG